MSKFFNETREASELSRSQANQDLDIKEMLDLIKQGSSSSTKVSEARLEQCKTVRVADGVGTPAVLKQDSSSKLALEAYRGLRTRLMRAQAKSGLRSIAVTSSIPGEGKTLTVLNLGLCFSQLSEQRVLVIDADLRTGGLTKLLGQPNAPGLAEALAGEVTPSAAVVSTDQKNLFALTSGMVSTQPPELFASTQWQELLGWCSETFSVVLVDTPPISPLADFELISSACDGIVMVVRAQSVRRETVRKIVQGLDSKKFLGVVFNGTEVDHKGEYGYGYGDR
jgi:capsular exopolysaccharide synthesis family protein